MNKHRYIIGIAVLLLAGLCLFAVGMGTAAATETGTVTDTDTAALNETDVGSDAEPAALLVDQPEYVDGDVVRQTDSDGTPVYIASGREIHLRPEFDTENLSDFGIETSAGSLTEDSQWDRWTLEATEEGSYRVFWVTEETVVVEEGNETTTATEETRYEAVIRVDELADITIMSGEEATELQEQADEFEDINATLTELRSNEYGIQRLPFFGPPADNAALLETMADAYVTTRSPVNFLDGGFVAGVIILSTTLGGLFVVLLLKGPDLLIISRLRAEIRKRRGVEELEGELAERMEQADYQTRMSKAANWEWQSIKTVTEHEAVELRENVADNPLAWLVDLIYTYHPQRMKDDRLKAMGQCGYLIQSDVDLESTEDPPADKVDVVEKDDVLGPDETVADRSDLYSLRDPSERLLSAVPLDTDAIYEFDLMDADFDPDVIDTQHSLTLTELIEEYDFGQWSLEKERAGEILADVLEQFNDHPITDEEGGIDPIRLQMERQLQALQQADDQWDLPLARIFREHFSAALDAYDKDEETRRFLDRHRSGLDGGAD